MACRESSGSKILLCLTLLVVFGSICHCARLTTLKALDKLRGNSTHVVSQSKGRDVRHGRLLIGQDHQLGVSKATNSFLDVNTDYQQDMGWGDQKQLQERRDVISKPESKVVECLLKMDPRVECMGDSMKLQIQYTESTPGSTFFVDRGSLLSPLPLSKLPLSCGYTIQSTQSNLVLVAPYDGCFVALEEDCYVLPLRWSGLPVRMSCPLRHSSPNPPMVACHPQGMVVKTGWTVSVANINVNLIGDWEPLMTASSRCGFSIVEHSEGVVISARYAPCLEKKNGMYTLDLAGEQEIRISCPSLFPPRTEQTPDGGLELKTPSHQVYPSSPSLLMFTQSNAPQVTSSVEQPYAKPPVTKQPTGQLLYPYPFYVKTPYVPPLAHTPEKTTHRIASQPEAPSSPAEWLPYPFYPKQTATPRPSQPEVPHSPVEQPLDDFNPKQTAMPRPSQPEAPFSPAEQLFYTSHLPTAAPWSSQPEAPHSPVEQPLDDFNPKQTAAPWPTGPWPPQYEAPTGPVQQPLYPFYPKPTAAPRPLQPEAPYSPAEQLPYPFYPKLTTTPRPPQPKTSPAPVAQPHYPLYPNPTGAPWLPQPEAPPGLQQLFYPFYLGPTASPRPPQPEALPGPVWPPHYRFYTQATAAPNTPQPEAPSSPVKPTLYPFPFYSLPKPSSVDSQNPLPVYCPPFCESVSYNCCPQIAFHHHVHQIIPFGLASPTLKGLQHQPSDAYSGFGSDLAFEEKLNPTNSMMMQATKTPTSVPISIPSLQSENAKRTHLLPPDGNLAALDYIPSKPANPEGTIYPYDDQRYLYPTWSYLHQSKELQSLAQSPSPASYSVPMTPQPQRYQENPMLTYGSHHVQPQKQQKVFGWEMNNNPFGSATGQYLQQEPIGKLQMPKDAESQINYKYTSNNITGLQILRGPRKSTNRGSTLHLSAEPKTYLLLQHGPPDGEPNGYNESPLPSGGLVHDANLIAHLSRHHGQKPESLLNLNAPQEEYKRPKLLGRGKSHLSPDKA